MWKVVLLVVIMMMVASPAYGFDEWTKEDTYWQLGVLASQIIDWGQTREIVANPNFNETNPTLGSSPTLEEVNRYFAACVVGNYTLSRILPKNWRRTWQVSSVAFQFHYIKNNYELGIGIKF
jgi:hypothetical protein